MFAPVDERIVFQEGTASGKGRYVLYWMQQAQRLHFNPALQYAATRANQMNTSLLVAFVIMDCIPAAEAEHYCFMLEGLRDMLLESRNLGLDFRIYGGDAVDIISALGHDACLVVMDHSCLAWQKALRQSVKDSLSCTLVTEIDTETVVPVHIASDKEEYSAATLRTKLLRVLPEYLVFDDPPLPELPLADCGIRDAQCFKGEPVSTDELFQFASERIGLWAGSRRYSLKGGYTEAKRHLGIFSETKLAFYSLYRNHPDKDYQSEMSPYLHFGQISPLDIIHSLFPEHDAYALRALLKGRKALNDASRNMADYLEELIVRRELSWNFCTYNEDYGSFACLPGWAKASLLNHIHDPRDKHYSLEVLENAETEDEYWNAAQRQMLSRGKMHNYMRMYWGKRVLAWFDSVEEAYALLLYLNDKYSLDGRDANSYAGVAWCFGKHDRPWAERPIYGMIRYMNDNGLQRKFDMQAYISKVASEEPR